MEEGLLALQFAEMLAWCAFRIAIRVSGWNVETIQDPKLVFQVPRRIWTPVTGRQGAPEAREGVAPGLLPKSQMDRLERFFRRLVGGETGPLVAAGSHRLLRLFQIPLGLIQPVG